MVATLDALTVLLTILKEEHKDRQQGPSAHIMKKDKEIGPFADDPTMLTIFPYLHLKKIRP